MDPTVQVALVSGLTLIVVTAIGVLTARITSGARKESVASAVDASASAELARNYAAAAGAKDALIAALDQRVEFLEEAGKECKDNVEKLKEELKLRREEDEEQKRAASQLERERVAEIDQLRQEIHNIKSPR